MGRRKLMNNIITILGLLFFFWLFWEIIMFIIELKTLRRPSAYSYFAEKEKEERPVDIFKDYKYNTGLSAEQIEKYRNNWSKTNEKKRITYNISKNEVGE